MRVTVIYKLFEPNACIGYLWRLAATASADRSKGPQKNKSSCLARANLRN